MRVWFITGASRGFGALIAEAALNAGDAVVATARDPNTVINGLNVIALKNIRKNEELTLDYSQFLDDNMEPFQCRCGSSNCRGLIKGVVGNSVTQREQKHYVLIGK